MTIKIGTEVHVSFQGVYEGLDSDTGFHAVTVDDEGLATLSVPSFSVSPSQEAGYEGRKESLEALQSTTEKPVDILLDLPEISVKRGGLFATGGWCAPSDHVFNLDAPPRKKLTKKKHIEILQNKVTELRRQLREIRAVVGPE